MFFLLLAVAVYLTYAFLIVYHLTRFGIGTQPKTAALIFFIGATALLLIVAYAYARVDWVGAASRLSQVINVNFHFQPK